MAEPFTGKKWGLWVQPDGPNTDMKFLGCHELDDIEEPGGGIAEVIRCFDPKTRQWVVRGSTRTPPEQVTTKITGLIETTADYLEKIVEGANCPFPFYANGKTCPPDDVFPGAVRTYALPSAEIGTKGLQGLRKFDEDPKSTQSFEVSAWPPISRYRNLVAQRQPIAEYSNLNDVSFCNVPKCADDCGAAQAACDDGIAVSDAPAGSPAVTGDVWLTTNGGAAWAMSVADPFAAAVDLISCTCFQINSTTTRLLVVREGVVGTPAAVAYSDDWGATWTTVTLATINNAGALYGGALFSFDMYHIWLALASPTVGYIFFSDDGGATWTQQAGGAGGLITNALRAIWFSDYQTGMAVGTSDTAYATTDGGLTWDAVAATGSGHNLQAVTENGGGGIWWVGTTGGVLYFSTDQGQTWTVRAFSGSGAGDVGDVRFYDTLCGFMAHNRAASAGAILYRTKNGGVDWEPTNTVTNRGINALWDCSINKFFGVGDIQPAAGGTAVVLRAEG